MEKQEFLEKLRHALSGRLTPEAVAENINYYTDYINTEIRKGKNEEDVMAALGDPRLIARTIVETNPSQAGAKGGFVNEEQGSQGDGQYGKNSGFRFSRIPLWVWLVLVILAVILVLSAVFSILSMILPVLLPILVILFLVKLFRVGIQ